MASASIIFSILVLILSVVIHEVAHGYAAYWLGDPTAKLEGRLTLNPIKHLDFFGSVLVPTLTVMVGGFIFGWAKPVPYNPYNIQNKWGDAIVAVAGPASNILVALIFGIVLRLHVVSPFLPASAPVLMASIVLINLILAVFNLVPIPPLDGSKILANFLPTRYTQYMHALQSYWLFILVFFVLFLWQIIFPIISFLFTVFTGLSL